MKHIAPLLAAFFVLATESRAGLIAYTETVSLSGSLGSTAFTNALVTFVQTADTNAIVTSGIDSEVQDLTSTLTIAGVGTASFILPTFTRERQNTASDANFYLSQGSFASNGVIILGIHANGNYSGALQMPSGRVPGMPSGSLASYATSAGTFTVTDFIGQASFQTVPEPSSLALCGMAGVVGLGVARARDRAVKA